MSGPDFEAVAKETIANLYPPSYEATVNITLPADQYNANATMSISGLTAEYNSSAYPEAVVLNLNDTTIWSFQKTGFGPLGRQDRFSTDSKQAKLDFSKGGGSANATIRLPKGAYVQRSAMQVNGSKTPSTSELVGLGGQNIGDMFGYSAICAGDVNKDGYDDVIVGAPSNGAGGIEAGRAYLYFGGPNMDNKADVIFTGAAIDDRFGGSVSGAGDVNKDGYDDVIIGARYNDAGGYNAGRAYIFFGGQNMDNVADVTLTGAAAEDTFGLSVSGAGDVNNDGYDDVTIGAPGNDSAGNNAGAAYVYFGGQNMDANAEMVMTGEYNNSQFGRTASSAGDVNNDGYDDVVVGSSLAGPTGSQTGLAYLYLGGKTPDDLPDVIFKGEGDGDYFSFRGLSGGDINNDSYSDVIVGAGNNDAGGNRAGRAYLYNGSRAMDNISEATFTGFAAEDWFGSDASFAGDVNKDGYGDLIISATGNDSASTNAGVVYIFFGGQSMDTIPDRTYIGPAQHWWFGDTVNRAGDVNNDGYDDFLIAWDDFQNASNDPGYVNIYSLNDPIKGILDASISIGPKTIWNRTGYFNGTAMLDDFSQQLNDYIRSAPASGSDENGNLFVDVPVTVRTKSEGNINFTDLAIVYQYNATVPNFATALNGYLSAHKNEKDLNGNLTIPLKVRSLSAGRTKLYALNMTRDMPPALTQQFKPVTMDEDTSNATLLDLYNYFKDDTDISTSLNFSIVSSTNDSYVRLWITNKRYLSADAETGDLNNNWTGTIEAAVACSDHWGQKTESNRFTIIVRNVNDPPVITSKPVLRGDSGVPYFYNLTAYDVDNDTLFFRLNKVPPDMIIGARTGEIRWMPVEKGYFEVDVEASDGNATVHQNYFITVGNLPPRITSTPPLSATTGVPYYYNVTAEDPNLDILTFSVATEIVDLGINATTGKIAWTPAYAGNFDVTIIVSDGKLRAEQNFTINVAQGNRAPRFLSKATISAQVGVPYPYTAKAADEDGDSITFSIVSGPPGMVIDGTSGTVTWTPASMGNFSVTLKASDGKGGETFQEFIINVAGKTTPGVDFITPSEGQKVRGKFTITGVAMKGASNVTGVQLRVDSGDWMDAKGTMGWQITLDTSKLKNGKHTLQARAFDGTDYSDPVNRTITVDNPKQAQKGFIPMMDGGVALAVLAMAGAVLFLRRR